MSESVLPAFIHRNLKTYTTYTPLFQRVFGVSLKRFWSHLTGFDLVAFDDFLECGEESVEDTIRQHFGEAGVDLILRLIRAEIAAQENVTV